MQFLPPPIAIAAGRVWERSGSQWHIQRLHRFWPVGGEAGLTAPAPMESAAGLTAPAPLDPETGLTAPAPLDHQASLADPSTTASPFSVCSSARDGGCRAALATFSIQVTTDAAWFWRAAGGSKQETCRTWRMWARAGALVYDVGLCEVQRYPWKLCNVLESGLTAAEDVVADYMQCPNVLDSVSQNHLQRYGTADALTSPESKAELAAIATVLAETTVEIERGHATTKRQQRAKGLQGHVDALHLNNAERVLAHFRQARPAALRPTETPSPAAKKKKKKKKKVRKRERRGVHGAWGAGRRRLGLWQAYLTLHHPGGPIRSEFANNIAST